MVAPLGFAPRPRGLEPPVLLLHYRASSKTTIWWIRRESNPLFVCLQSRCHCHARATDPLARLICLSDQRAPTTLSLHCLEETDGIEPSLSVWNPYLAVRVFGGVYGIRTREIPDRQSGGVDHWPNTPKITCLSCKLCTCSLANSQTS